MAGSTKSPASSPIEKLLAERQTITQWLDRLAMAGDSAPNEVRDRVKNDYESRLTAVNAELQGYTADLRESLAKHTQRRAELTQTEAAADARLEEAKLRHAVGEFDDATWNKTHSDILNELVKVREELETVRGEIGRLEDVLSSIEAPPPTAAPAPAASAPPAPEPAPAPPASDAVEFIAPEEPSAPPEPPPAPAEPAPPAPAQAPAAAAPAPPRDSVPEWSEAPASVKGAGQAAVPNAEGQASGKQRDAFDELAFLKTVAKNEEPAPADDEATGRFSTTDRSNSKKTLKCEECGEMNLPTEWYCESCGAELAAL